MTGEPAILEAFIHDEQRYAETWPQMTALITEVMTSLATEDPDSPWIVPGEVAWFMFVDRRRADPYGPPWPNNYLSVAVNTKTGYGGLTWFITERSTIPAGDKIANHVGVTDNPSPPDFDPGVVSDPGYPLFYHPNSTIPVTQVRTALEEFCRTGPATGRSPSPGYVGRRTAVDEAALTGALHDTNDEAADGWFEYPLAGTPTLVIRMAQSSGSAVVSVRVEGTMDLVLATRIETLLDLL